MPIPARWLIAAAVAVLLAASGWYVRGLVADRDMAAFKDQLRQQQDDQRDLTMRVEAADVQNTQASTARIDVQEQQREAEVRYVDREVVKYRVEYRDRACQLPDRWVCIYNRSLGLPCGVSETGIAGPSPDGTGVHVPAGGS
ncbi:hypothetical protein D3C81_1595980 [compost metagenome]